MQAIFGWLGSLGAGLVIAVLSIGMFVGAIFAGVYAYNATNRKWVGWLVGLLIMTILALIFGPAIDAMKRAGCEYHACDSGDDDAN
jgi:hypothetical protein